MNKRILVAPLNWGLGHATRCIPIIYALIEDNFESIIASDGAALLLLKKEFPELTCIELPSYNITYSKTHKSFRLKLLKQLPKLLKTIKKENNFVNKIVDDYNIDGIISDNRFGVYNSKVPSVYMTHQLNVLSGNTTWLTTKMHQFVMNKFDECWIPDYENGFNLSGTLGHINDSHFNTKLKYIGPLSRLKKEPLDCAFDLLVLLSGPEPQRTLLEDKLMKELNDFNGKILFVKGIFEDKQAKVERKQFTFYNYMETEDLEKAINQSELIITRSGYSTIMDLAKLNKKAFFIPTPRQYEQEYLASYLKGLKLAPCCSQDDFKIEKLEELNYYNGLKTSENTIDFKELFGLF
ncbi:MAG TPA: glycosyltransferase [Flavobacteriaceae bacterium]|nr:glycosyltransferase [Flavobacteriaceae bacterium]